MASLAASLANLTTPHGRLEAARATLAHVYGAAKPGVPWAPRPYADNKGRYLWTDAFGVVNFISLAAETGDPGYLQQAEGLITAVHDSLGRERGGCRRLGAATDAEPTRGGLRIGKVHAEGHPDGDGQYFHYNTKWAFALSRMALATGDAKYHRWAVQLMEAVHPHFVAGGGGPRPRMFWKISVDMSEPLVGSEGNLDPFDGLVTCRLLRDPAAGGDPSVLAAEVADFERMVEHKHRRYSSSDPLDLGEALWLSHWALDEQPWARLVAERSADALGALWSRGYFRQPEPHRLAFREFGTTLGVQVNPAAGREWAARVDALHAYWAQRLFTRDRDITPVMFASSLLPGAWQRGYEGKLQALRRAAAPSEE